MLHQVPPRPVRPVRPHDTAHAGMILSIALMLTTTGAGHAAEPLRGLCIVPQSHIDVAWFWRYEPETIEVCIPWTFGRAADLLERMPDYSFSAPQVPLYEGLRRYHPALSRRIDKLIQARRFEVVGGPWVEFEGTGPAGESLVRQCVYGKRYFKEVYGLDVRNAWQVDAWSHPWTLPQILKKSEIDFYVFKRGLRGERIFWWASADGSRVLAVNPFTRGGRFNDLKTVLNYHNNIKARYGIDLSMWLYGEGDHGGGMTFEEIEALKLQMAAAPTRVQFSRADNFLAELGRLAKPDWPVLGDELGWELEGCHTNACRLKAANRRCENLLIEAETFSAIAARITGLPYPRDALQTAWLDVLFNQFHDIISGAVVPAGYEDAMDAYDAAEQDADAARRQALDALTRRIDTSGEGTPVVVFNPLAWPRSGAVEAILECKEPPGRIVLAAGAAESTVGQILLAQPLADGWQVRCLFVARDVPSLGYKTYHARIVPASASQPQTPAVTVDNWRMESDTLALRFDPVSGDLSGIRDKIRNTELLPEQARANRVDLIEDKGDTEGTIKFGQVHSPKPLETWNGWKVVEAGPVRTTVRIRNKLDNLAAVDRFVSLYTDPAVPWLQFRTHFEWNGIDRMVKIAFATRYPKARPVYDIPYGTIARDATGDERPALNWVDLGDSAGGVALLNDCRYGHDVKAGVMRINALRSLTYHATHTEAGHQELTYALYPHTGDFKAGRVMHRGYEFNHPMLTVTAETHEGSLPAAGSFVTVDPPNVILSVIKLAEDSDHLVARAYEIDGQKCTARVTLTGLGVIRASLTNLLEKPLGPVKVQSDQTTTLSVPVGAYEIVTVDME